MNMHAQLDSNTEKRVQDAERLAGKGQYVAAGRIYDVLLKQNPDSSGYRARRGEMAYAAGDAARAIELLNPVLETDPENVQLLKVRGSARARHGDIEGALDDASLAVTLAPSDPEAAYLLGSVLYGCKRYEEAVLCFGDAVRQSPTAKSYLLALADSFIALQKWQAAEELLNAVIAEDPATSFTPYGMLATAYLKQRCPGKAVSLLEEAGRQGFNDSRYYQQLGNAYITAQQTEKAVTAFEAVLRLEPDNTYAKHLLAAARGQVTNKASGSYAAQLFDSYADSFDKHLVELHYRVPGLVRRAVERIYPSIGPEPDKKKLGRILDLGCGTGLVGVVLSDILGGFLKGVDISSKMVAKSQEKQIYSELETADIQELLQQDKEIYDLVIAADVLCYFGELEELFKDVRAHLLTGGVFIFSVESHPEDAEQPYTLSSSARYRHQKSYVEDAIVQAGFSIEEIMEENLRMDFGNPVQGLLVVAHAAETCA
ncbi:tetratricopeptide repeat protein [Fodinicurvata sediminis]|uniref:tetratricopeptide repeat protein n=1 Tax=Fodinicurvata sediminis TaxID=1121832 RepID=UPI0003B48D9C|nr:tetratricopeptide repeat protein [Fodinicurvata sediminis]